MASTTTKLWTAAEVRALPEDGRRYEVIDGILFVNGVEVPGGDLAAFADVVTPAPSWRHGDAVRRLFRLLDRYLESEPVGDARFAPADVSLGDAQTVQPDLFVVPLVDGRPPRDWEEAGRLLLAIEVLSPATARQDRVLKRRLYKRAGVPEYWIVDLDARAIERWRPEDERAELLVERLEWRPEGATTTLVIDLEKLFAEIEGD